MSDFRYEKLLERFEAGRKYPELYQQVNQTIYANNGDFLENFCSKMRKTLRKAERQGFATKMRDEECTPEKMPFDKPLLMTYDQVNRIIGLKTDGTSEQAEFSNSIFDYERIDSNNMLYMVLRKKFDL